MRPEPCNSVPRTIKRREKNKSDQLKSREVTKHEDGLGSSSPTEQLKALIDELNQKALSDELKPHEVAEIRELLPKLRDMMEGQRRVKWLLKSIGMFLLAAPALTAMWQIWARFIEWVKGQ
jgi:hypothetical protein